MQSAISVLREQQAQAQAELRASQQKLSAVSFAVTGGHLAIPQFDERFAADQPDLQKWLADPCFKLWQEALDKQAREAEETRRAQEETAAAAQAVKDAELAAVPAADGAGTTLPAAGAGGANLARPDPDLEFMDLDDDTVDILRAAAVALDKRALADFLGQQGVVKKQRQG